MMQKKTKNTQNEYKPVNPKYRDTQKHTHTCHTVPQVLVFCVFITICLEIMYNTTFKCISTKIISEHIQNTRSLEKKHNTI